MDIYKALSTLSENPKVQLIEAEHEYLTAEEKAAIAKLTENKLILSVSNVNYPGFFRAFGEAV